METVPVSFNEGIKKILLRDYAGAVTHFNRSIEEEPNNIAAYNNRGYAKNKLKDTVGEIEDYTKAIDIDPKDELLAISDYKNVNALYFKQLASRLF